MARQSDHPAGDFASDNTDGLLSGFLAEEEDFDRRAMWRLGSWGAVSVAAVIVALLANQSSISVRREQIALADLARQSQQVQSAARETQNEARRLASAVDTLNGDRDRLYSRVTVLEQGLDSVTGAIARQASVPPLPLTTAPVGAAEPQTPAPNPAAVATISAGPADRTSAKEPRSANVASLSPENLPKPVVTPATPLVAAKSLMAPPDASAGKLLEPEPGAKVTSPDPAAAVIPTAEDTEVDSPIPVAVQRTDFGADVGSANSISGLRALWRGLLKSSPALASLRPIIVVKESNSGLGMQLRLVAGPLADAAAAAKICAGLIESERPCETAMFDGQSLAMKTEESPVSPKPTAHKRKTGRVVKRAASDLPEKKPEGSTLSLLFGKR